MKKTVLLRILIALIALVAISVTTWGARAQVVNSVTVTVLPPGSPPDLSPGPIHFCWARPNGFASDAIITYNAYQSINGGAYTQIASAQSGLCVVASGSPMGVPHCFKEEAVVNGQVFPNPPPNCLTVARQPGAPLTVSLR